MCVCVCVCVYVYCEQDWGDDNPVESVMSKANVLFVKGILPKSAMTEQKVVFVCYPSFPPALTTSLRTPLPAPLLPAPTLCALPP